MNASTDRLFLELRDEKQRQINELAEQATAIERQRQELMNEVRALDVLLKGAGHIERDAPVSLEGMGFRDAVRTLLRESPGLNVKQLAAQLESRGYIYTAQTPLKLRLSNDLNRMRDQKIVAKRNDGYVLTEKGAQM